MSRLLYLTTELPYFPGQGGLMALHIRHLTGQGFTGVVGPRYPHQPEDALQRMRDLVTRSYWWPEHPQSGVFFAAPKPWTHRTQWLKLLPHGIRYWLWRRLTGLDRGSDDALAWRSALNNLAPKILEALEAERWNAVLLSQSNSAAWLPFLPASLARTLYFHDIRSDYLRRSPTRLSRSSLRRILAEEQTAMREVDAVAVVSELDQNRAQDSLRPAHPVAVAPICIDLDYFAFQPAPSGTLEPIVLFTGHLSHPPNVDAAVYFIASIWPHILAVFPRAIFRIVGIHPNAKLVEAVSQAIQVELVSNVPDIRPYFREASVYVVPMRYGGGVRQKILEAWAVGVPVVTTTLGAEGIAAQDGVNCWLRDDPAKFADQVSALLRQPVITPVLQAARALAEAQHSSAVSSPQLAGQIRIAVQRRQQAAPKVLYDLRWLEPGKAGGVEQMTHELVSELATFDRTLEYRFLGSSSGCRNLELPAGFKHKIFYTDGLMARWLSWRDAAANKLASDLAQPVMNSPELSALEWYTRLDFTVVHGLPCTVHADLRRFPSVVTMHDLQHLHLPGYFSPADIATREREYRDSCQRASHIICISEYTRQDVHQHYGVPLEKMTTIWNLPPRLTGAPMARSTIRQLLGKMGIKPPFLFYPAQPWLHKNHRGLLEAMQLLASSLPSQYKLVLTGQPFPADHPAAALLLDPHLRHRVMHLGYRSASEVAALYHSAEALIFPSLFEGFGMPLVEAMQSNLPIVCGRHTCLPEIVGDAALFADVASPEALAEAILSITRNDSLRGKLRQSGAENLPRFNRRNLAEKTRAIYSSIHEQHFT